MQMRNSRRGFLAGSLAVSATAVAPATASSFLALPSGPMILRRWIQRELRGGAKINVSREWRIEFIRGLGGVEVSGVQLTANVDAPIELSELARIEENRPTDSMFPISLGVNGLIITAAKNEDSASVEAAIRTAEKMIDRLPRSNSDKAHMRQAITRLQNSNDAQLSTVPKDLFFPVGRQFEDSRQMSLPDGSNGKFTVIYGARRARRGPWLEQASRQILTRINDDTRRSKEVWTMQPG